MRKALAAIVAAVTLLGAAQAEAGGFRSRTVIRNNGRGHVVVNSFATPVFVQPTFFAPQFVQPTFVPVQPNVFVPFGFHGFATQGFGCH